jgi:hypothetical protein
MTGRIEFDPDRVTAAELQLAQTKEEIFQKLKVIFGQRDEQGSRSGVTGNSRGAISTRTFGKIGGQTKSVAQRQRWTVNVQP